MKVTPAANLTLVPRSGNEYYSTVYLLSYHFFFVYNDIPVSCEGALFQIHFKSKALAFEDFKKEMDSLSVSLILG